MLRRNHQNIGRKVIIKMPENLLHNRIGRIVGFQGEYAPGIPWVRVQMSELFNYEGSIYLLAANCLKPLK